MAKNSLIISEDEKYGNSPGALTAPGEKSKKPKKSKFAPTIELTASQIEAFGLVDPKQGDTGCSKVHWRIKTVSDGGDSYGDRLPDKTSPQKVSLTFTHVEACEPGEDAGEEEEAPEGEEEKPAAEEGEADDTKPTTEAKDTLSPAQAGLDEEE